MPAERPYLGQNCTTPYPAAIVLRRALWSLVQASLFRWSPRPLHGFRARLLKMFGADIAAPGEVVVFPTAKVLHPWNLAVAPRAMIGPGVTLYNPGRIILRRGANVSQNCHLCAGTHDFTQWSMPLVTGDIDVGANVWLAADVFVGPGVTIGELCVVGARSVVVRSLPPRTVCVGNPCRPIKERVEPQSP